MDFDETDASREYRAFLADILSGERDKPMYHVQVRLANGN